jgi:hypothetical protein
LFPTWVYSAPDLCHTALLTTSCIQSKKANFDASHELEELLLEDNPLKAKARKQNRDINSLSAEMRQMEEQCVGAHANHVLELHLIVLEIDSQSTTSVRCIVARITRKINRSSQQ